MCRLLHVRVMENDHGPQNITLLAPVGQPTSRQIRPVTHFPCTKLGSESVFPTLSRVFYQTKATSAHTGQIIPGIPYPMSYHCLSVSQIPQNSCFDAFSRSLKTPSIKTIHPPRLSGIERVEDRTRLVIRRLRSGRCNYQNLRARQLRCLPSSSR